MTKYEEKIILASKRIAKYIHQIPEGEVFTHHAFRQLASADNVRQVLNRLCKKKLIRRLVNGLFVKETENFNISAIELTKKTGEMITMHGALAARHLKVQISSIHINIVLKIYVIFITYEMAS